MREILEFTAVTCCLATLVACSGGAVTEPTIDDVDTNVDVVTHPVIPGRPCRVTIGRRR